MNLQHILAIAGKEWREILRDRLFLLLALVIPPLMMLVLYNGLVLEVRNLPLAVLDQDKSALSRAYVDAFRLNRRYFNFIGEADNAEQLESLLRQNRIRFAIIVPPRFAERLRRGQPASVQVLIDGQFTYHARITRGYVALISAAFNRQLLNSWLGQRRGLSPVRIDTLMMPVRLEVRYLFNQALESRWSVAPGLIILIMLMVPALLVALSVVREKEQGSIYNFYASSVSRSAFLLGKLMPYWGLSLIGWGVLSVMAIVLFEAPFRGDALAYVALGAVYVLAAMSIGVVVSVFVSSQAAAALITMLGTMIPGILFSGLLMPLASMSPEARLEAHLFPAMYGLEALWGLYLKGDGWHEALGHLLTLALYASVLLTLAVALFRKRLKR